MANKAITKAARRAARVAAAVAQEELARLTRANVEDLATFFSARERAETVDGWLAERQQVLLEQAAQRRAEQREACGRALRAMRDRGQTLREIARMASIPIALDSPLSEERCIELQQLWLVELLKPLFAEPRNHVRVGIVFPVLLGGRVQRCFYGCEPLGEELSYCACRGTDDAAAIGVTHRLAACLSCFFLG